MLFEHDIKFVSLVRSFIIIRWFFEQDDDGVDDYDEETCVWDWMSVEKKGREMIDDIQWLKEVLERFIEGFYF